VGAEPLTVEAALADDIDPILLDVLGEQPADLPPLKAMEFLDDGLPLTT
jgi:hypothetical protein